MNDTTDETAPLTGTSDPSAQEESGTPSPGAAHSGAAHSGAAHPGAAGTSAGPGDRRRNAFDDLQHLRLSRTDRHVAGVAGGLGRHFGIDPTILRVLFVVLTFFGAAGLVLYGAIWLLVPKEGSDRAAVEVSPDVRKALLLAAAVVAALLAIGDSLGGFSSWPLGVLAVILFGTYLIVRDRNAPGLAAHHGSPEEGTTMTTTHDHPVGPAPADPDAASAPPYWQPPGTGQPPAHQPPRRPRRTGIVWFWPTLALIAIGLGILGVYDADHHVADGAYPALALAITGVMLVVGSLRGRPGGLILLGIVSALGLSATTVVGGSFGTDARQVHETPLTAAAVQPAYHHSVGEIELDLTQVQDPESLAGRTVDLELRTGSIRVIVPRELNVDVDALVEFGGDISVDGEHRGGWGTSVERHLSASPASGTEPLELDLETRFGQITVEQR